ncbi:MAG: shikimate kinase [Planctomycetota bacterium]
MTEQPRPPTVVLIGLRGSGKSTVGRLLASELGTGFLDLDTATLVRAGTKDVAALVERTGWEGFRSLEREALASALEAPPGVLALGGGTPTDAGSRTLLAQAADHGHCSLVYLRCQPAGLAARMQATADRPSLTGADPFGEIDALFQARDPLYLEIAQHVLETDGMTAQDVVEALARIG